MINIGSEVSIFGSKCWFKSVSTVVHCCWCNTCFCQCPSLWSPPIRSLVKTLPWQLSCPSSWSSSWLEEFTCTIQSKYPHLVYSCSLLFYSSSWSWLQHHSSPWGVKSDCCLALWVSGNVVTHWLEMKVTMCRTVYVCMEDFSISWCSNFGVRTAGCMLIFQDDVHFFAYIVNGCVYLSVLASSRVFVITAMTEFPTDWRFYE